MNKFRVTLWFKKGLLDADQADAAAAGDDALHPAASDLLPVEDRYADDGSITRDDRRQLSLETGHTQHLRVMPALHEHAEGPEAPSDVRVLVRDAKRGRGVVIAMMAASLAVMIGIVAMIA